MKRPQKLWTALLATLLLAACGAAGGLDLPYQPHQKDNPLRKKTEGQNAPQSPAPAPADPATPPQTTQP